jgi:hypothetical protein
MLINKKSGAKDSASSLIKPKRHIQMTLQSEDVNGYYLDLCMTKKPRIMTTTLSTKPNFSRGPTPGRPKPILSAMRVKNTRAIPHENTKNPT